MTEVGGSSREWMADRDDGLRSLDEGDFAAATVKLTNAAAADPTGDCESLLGLACFRREDYAAAAEHYEAALARGGPRSDWQEMLVLSRANTQSEIDVYVPDPHYFDRDALLAPPPDPLLPAAASHGLSLGLLKRVRYLLGHAVGTVGGVAFDGVVELLGRHYHGQVWTNWYRKRLYRGILTLAYMREKLDRDNLMSTYPTGNKVAFQADDLQPPPGVTHYRTADGSWNNLDDRKEGAAGTRFPRNVTNAADRAGGRRAVAHPQSRD